MSSDNPDNEGSPKDNHLGEPKSAERVSQTLGSKELQKLELSFIELNKERARQKEWKKLIRDMVLQRGKIPLLLAVEAGNQSMVRELLSSQTAEQLKVSLSLSWQSKT